MLLSDLHHSQAKDKLKNEYKEDMTINDALKLGAVVLSKAMDVRYLLAPLWYTPTSYPPLDSDLHSGITVGETVPCR